MTDTNRRVLLKSRPQGEPTKANFDVVDAPMPEPKDGEFLSRTIYLSLDPYMRGRMSARPSPMPPVELGEPMVGGTVGAGGQVDAIRSSRTATSSLGYCGLAELRRLQRHHVDASSIPTAAPLSAALACSACRA